MSERKIVNIFLPISFNICVGIETSLKWPLKNRQNEGLKDMVA